MHSFIWGYNSSDNEYYSLLVCDTVWSVRRSPKFRSNELIRSSGSKSEPSKQPTRSSQEIYSVFTSCLFRAWLCHRPWRWKQYSPLIRWQTSTGQHGITTQKAVHLCPRIYRSPCLVSTFSVRIAARNVCVTSAYSGTTCTGEHSLSSFLQPIFFMWIEAKQ
jgi:hypothetical protein